MTRKELALILCFNVLTNEMTAECMSLPSSQCLHVCMYRLDGSEKYKSKGRVKNNIDLSVFGSNIDMDKKN